MEQHYLCLCILAYSICVCVSAKLAKLQFVSRNARYDDDGGGSDNDDIKCNLELDGENKQ